MQVVTELKNRGVADIFIACVDGLKGFAEAIEAVFPQAQVQLCLVHLVRDSLPYVSWKHRKEVATDVKKIYQSATREEAERQRERFAEKWDRLYPSISQSWRRNWERVVVFFAYPAEIRKVIYTTNAIESVNMSLSQDHQKSRVLSDRRSSDKTIVPGAAKYQPEVEDADQGLEGGAQSVQYHL